jgi:peptide/nickel transport system permease protein
MAELTQPDVASPSSLTTPTTQSQNQPLKNIVRSYWFRIILQGVIVTWVIITFLFFLIRYLPGNPVEVRIDQLLNQGYTTEEAQRIAAGLFNFDPDEPMIVQYFNYMGDLLRGDLGQSITSAGTPVSQIILRFLPWTLISLGSAFLVSFFTGVLVGTIIAYWRGTLLDNVVTTIASITSGIPDYAYAIGIIIIGGVQLQLYSVGDMRGGVDPTLDPGFYPAYILSVMAHAFLPALTYFLTVSGVWILLMKSSTIATLGEDYIKIAKARGLPERRILVNYVGRNSLLPMIARAGISFGYIIGGSVIVELFFEYPGLGRALLNAVATRDYTTMQGIFLMITVFMIISNMISDLLLGMLDPRIRLGEET